MINKEYLKNRQFVLLKLFLINILWLNYGLAQDTIIADRPGIGSGAYVLKSYLIQLESGIEFSKSPNVEQYNLGQLLLRYGIPLFEIQAALNSYIIQNTPGQNTNGLQDFALGIKAPLVSAFDGLLITSLLAKVNLPVGESFLTSDEFFPSFITFTNSFAVNSAWGIYFGYAGFYSSANETHIIEAGTTLIQENNVQYDINSGFDLEKENYFIGIGVAVRFK